MEPQHLVSLWMRHRFLIHVLSDLFGQNETAAPSSDATDGPILVSSGTAGASSKTNLEY